MSSRSSPRSKPWGRPPFVVVEGLIGSGKSTVARAVGSELGLENVEIVAPEFAEVRQRLDDRPDCLDPRFALWYTIVLEAAVRIRSILGEGRGCVVDSWIYRTIATHRCLGSDLHLDIPDWMPSPTVSVYLVVPPEIRQARVTGRGGRSNYWKDRCEELSAEIEEFYLAHYKGLVSIDASDGTEAVVATVVQEVRRVHPELGDSSPPSTARPRDSQ